VFDTLTVRTEYLEKIFEKNSKTWKNYITSFRRKIGIEKYGNKKLADRKFKTDKYHQYFAVTELGGNRGRLHIHTIHIFSYLPSLWTKDPNHYGKTPFKRLINGPQILWPYGFSYPIAVRISQFDAWGKKNWKWPVKKDGQPIEPTIPAALATYMIKYITKGENKCQNLKTWRIKKSRNLGKKILNLTLQQTPMKDLKAITNSEKKILLNHKIVPKNLLVSMATKYRTQKMKKKNSSQKLFQLTSKITPQDGLVKLIRQQTETQRIPNYLTSGNSTIKNYKTTAIFNFQKLLNINFKKYLAQDYHYKLKGITHS
jgi:hypothetical protein